MQELPILLFLAVTHTIFSIIFILNKKHRALYDFISSLWLLFVCLATVRRSLHIYYGENSEIWFLKIVFYPLTYGPCLYLYTRAQTKNEKKLRLKDFLHFLPFIFFTLISLSPNISFSKPKIHSPEGRFSLILFELFAVLSWVSCLLYSYFVYRMIKVHSQNLLEKFSYLSIENTLSWVNRFSLVFLIFLSIQNIISFYTNFTEQKIGSGQVNGWLLLGFLYVLSFFFLRQDSVFSTARDSKVSSKKEKYSKSGLSEDKIQNFASLLVQYMETEKPYLKPDLVISDIANAMNISVNNLSQVINSSFGKNFFLFINDYRVKEVISKMQNPAYSEYTVLRIAYEAGFNSKSSFNSIFRKSTGLTPVEFRSKIN